MTIAFAAAAPDRQRLARERLASLLQGPAPVSVIHYACQSLDQNEREGSPRVTAVAQVDLASGAVTSYSIHAEAELARLAPVQILSRMDQLERAMLDKLYAGFAARRETRLVHWNMRDEVFGFPALALRYSVLGGRPVDPGDTHTLDLARILRDIYGPGYVAPPRLLTLARLNGLPTRGYLDGKAEAEAFERGQYAAVKRSTLLKLQLIVDVLHLARENALKTAAPGTAAVPVRRHVFVSHASQDRETAAAVVQLLESQGRRCWIAPRDVPLGKDFQGAIVEAIETAEAVVLVLSEAANASQHVIREINLADEEAKSVFTLCLGGARPKGSLRYQLNNRQWTDVGAELPGAVEALRQSLP